MEKIKYIGRRNENYEDYVVIRNISSRLENADVINYINEAYENGFVKLPNDFVLYYDRPFGLDEYMISGNGVIIIFRNNDNYDVEYSIKIIIENTVKDIKNIFKIYEDAFITKEGEILLLSMEDAEQAYSYYKEEVI